MKLALIADVHGNLAALEAVVADIRRRGVDEIFNLGDTCSGPLLPLETTQLVMSEGWLSIAGNHERQLVTVPAEEQGASDSYSLAQLTSRELDWMRSLPKVARPAPGVFLCHGTPGSDLEYFLETVEPQIRTVRQASSQEVEDRLAGESAALVACGHTHLPRCVRSRQGQLIVNPGSVGLPAYDATSPSPHVLGTGSPDARYAIVEKSPSGEWLATLIAVAYNHRAMAELAKKRQRPDWEEALLTGYLS